MLAGRGFPNSVLKAKQSFPPSRNCPNFVKIYK
jgi:hypothetical protein